MSEEIKGKPILEVEHLKMYFPLSKGFMKKADGVVKAVDDISFSVERGKTLGIVGESGCGKTTTGKCILQINKPTEGKILYQGQDLITMDRGRLKECRRDIQMIFQDPFGSLDPRQKAFSIIKEVLVEANTYHGTEEVKRKVNELLVKVGLSEEMGERYPHEMSGGQRQRLGIARALACDPKIIICDEPVSALDVSIQAQILNLLMDLQDQMGLTYLFITHDMSVVKHISNQICVMYLGQIVEKCDKSELFCHPVHPYTKALLSAIPTVDIHAKKERILLKGEIKSPINPGPGCRFATRCIYADESCKQNCCLQEVNPGHFVACNKVKEIEALG